MDYIDFKNIFFNNLKLLNNSMFNNISEEKYKMFYIYMNNILEWNKKINVTAVKDENNFIIKHYIDSLVVQNYILSNKCKIADIGTGAGFPGVPIKIINNDINITLVDSVNKKLNVIKESIKDFNLSNIEIIHGRVEELGNDKIYREKYDIVTSRAVSNFSTLVEYMLPLLKIGGIAICMKGPNFEEELNCAKNAIKILGGKIEKIDNYKILDNERNIIIIKKIKSTPKNYPRKNNKPLKEPIK